MLHFAPPKIQKQLTINLFGFAFEKQFFKNIFLKQGEMRFCYFEEIVFIFKKIKIRQKNMFNFLVFYYNTKNHILKNYYYYYCHRFLEQRGEKAVRVSQSKRALWSFEGDGCFRGEDLGVG